MFSFLSLWRHNDDDDNYQQKQEDGHFFRSVFPQDNRHNLYRIFVKKKIFFDQTEKKVRRKKS